MDESHFVDGVDGQRSFCNVELRDFFWQCVFFHEECHHIATGEELHDEVQINGILKAVVHFDHPGVIGLNQDVAFCPDVGQLFLGHHVGFPQDFHGVDVTCVDFLYQPHLESGILL